MTGLSVSVNTAELQVAAAHCAHCGVIITDSHRQRFCCGGCEAAYALVNRLGLGQFYARRRANLDVRPLCPDEISESDCISYVVVDAAGRCELNLMVDGLSCAACVWLIESVLGQEKGITGCRVNLTTRRLVLRWDGSADNANAYVARAAGLGFRLVPFDPARLADTATRYETELLKAMAVAGFAAGNVMLLSVSVWAGMVSDMGPAARDFMHWLSAVIALPAVAYAGRPFFRSALQALQAGRTNMDVPISVGILLAASMSLWETATSGQHAYFDSAVALIFFLLVGRYLDARARGRAHSAAEHLVSLGQRTVTVLLPDGSTRSQQADSLTIGQIVLVAAGERIGVDGRVISGRSELDASVVSGETLPVPATPGVAVFAGMVNLLAPLRIAVTATGSGTLLAEIVRLMEAAECGRGRFVTLADRVARLYAPVVHTLAAATFLAWYAIGDIGWQASLLNAVAVLIITCPCALALAVPVVQVVASGRLLRQGILLKSATALERLETVNTVVFDKTGTLTVGRPELLADPTRTDGDLRLAASLALVSRHPLARAIVRAAPATPVTADVLEHPGQGLSVEVPGGRIRLGSRQFCEIAAGVEDNAAGPEMWLSVPGRPAVRFAFSDQLKPDAVDVISELKRRKLQIELLSGDRTAIVLQAAAATGIYRWRAGCMPAAKGARLDELKAAGRHTLMVGDGLNDAPALATAQVSASPATAADISQTVADIVFLGDRLSPVVEIIDVARRVARLVRENLALAIVYNIGAVPLAMMGKVTPLIAAIAMSSSSLLVIGNALRLSLHRGEKR